jgi:hypothetical protein
MVLWTSLIFTNLHAQESSADLDGLYGELDSLFANETIPDLFRLADSLLAMDSAKISAFSIRTGYVSRIVTAGRAYGFSQYGIVPSVRYYHHSGIQAGITGYGSNELEPHYYLTNLSVGYFRTAGKHWNFSASHDFYLYNDTLDSHTFNKSVQASAWYQTRHSDVGVEYAFLYGEEYGHRVNATVNARLKLRTNGFINAIVLMPGGSLQFGNANIYHLRQPRSAAAELYQTVQQNKFPRLTARNYAALVYFLEMNRLNAARLLLESRGYTTEQMRVMRDTYYEGKIQEDNVFGFMNYAFSIPILMTHGQWTFSLNYTYNIPISLPGEDFEYDPNGYFSASLGYLLQGKKR